jgi:ABC-2 type transport system permease protein
VTDELVPHAVARAVSGPLGRARRSPIWHLTLARLRDLWRQPATLFWVFGFPIALSVALGAAFNQRGPEPIIVGAVRPLAPELDASLEAAGVTIRVLAPAEAARELRAGRVSLVLGPPGDPTAPLEYRYDSARTEARLARATVNAAVQHAAGQHDMVSANDRPVQEIGSRYIDALVPGLLGMNLMTGALWGIGWSLADLRTRRLLRRLRASPLRRRHLLASIALARMFVIPLEAAAILLFSHFAFGSPLTGSIWLLALVVLAGSCAFSGLGVLVGSRAQNGETASALVNLVMLPMFILSGVFFSTSHFPESVQPVIRALPLTAVNDALRAVILDGASLQDLARPLTVLAAWAAATFTLGLKLFRWT